VDEVGVFTPKRVKTTSLKAGEVGFLIANIKNIDGDQESIINALVVASTLPFGAGILSTICSKISSIPTPDLALA
jgi:hypothetical protein